MKKTEKQANAELMVDIDKIFSHCENQNANLEGGVAYLDFLRITNYVREHFEYRVPPKIAAALEIAEGLCHPDKIESLILMKRGLGASLFLTGGTSLVIGICYTLVHGLSLTTATGMLFWKTTTVSMLLGGPIGISVGVAALAGSIYMMMSMVDTKTRARLALEILRKAITEEGDEPETKKLENKSMKNTLLQG